MTPSENITGLGTRSDYVAPVPNSDPRRLTAEEQEIFDAVGRIARISDVIARFDHGEAKTIALLLALRAKGMIAPAKFRPPSHDDLKPIDASAIEEVDLEPERKQEILEMERRLDSANHFELLGIAVDASEDDVRKAYYALSRQFHPDRYFKKNLGSFRGRLERIFKRLNEANSVLSDKTRRATYVQQHPALAAQARAIAERKLRATPPPPPEDPARAAERRARLAHHPYLLKNRKVLQVLTDARALLAKKDYAGAVSLLTQVSEVDAKNSELQALLATARREMDNHRAEHDAERAGEAELAGNFAAAINAYRSALVLDPQNARAAARAAALILRLGEDPKEAKALAERAAQLEPRNAGYQLLYGKVLLEVGLKKLAKRALEEAVRLDAEQVEAKELLKKLRWTF